MLKVAHLLKPIQALNSPFSILKNPLFVGTLIGYAIGAYFWPGGYDSLYWFMRNMPAFVQTPAWVYLFTYPLSFLGWPLSWQVLILLTILVTALTHAVIFPDKSRWWLAVLNPAMLWNLWLGNIEVFTIAGLLLGTLIIQRKIHPAWWGVAAVVLLTKPQVGLGIVILFTILIWKAQGFRKLIPSGFVALFILLFTSLLWPGWIPRWIYVSITSTYNWWNGSIFPWGLAAWIPALLPLPMAGVQRLRMVAAATLLSSPYLALYHCTTLLTLYTSPVAFILSYAVIALGLLFTPNWMKMAWTLPAALIAMDMLRLFLERKKQNRSTPPPLGADPEIK